MWLPGIHWQNTAGSGSEENWLDAEKDPLQPGGGLMQFGAKQHRAIAQARQGKGKEAEGEAEGGIQGHA